MRKEKKENENEIETTIQLIFDQRGVHTLPLRLVERNMCQEDQREGRIPLEVRCPGYKLRSILSKSLANNDSVKAPSP